MRTIRVLDRSFGSEEPAVWRVELQTSVAC